MSVWIPPGHRTHDGQPDCDVRWCECSGRCTSNAPCDCCELADLRVEVERLTAALAESERLLKWWVVQGMAFAQLVNRQRDRIGAALALHLERTVGDLHYCQSCMDDATGEYEYPCPTVQALRGES